MSVILKVTARQHENSLFFRKLLFLLCQAPTENVLTLIALKFSAKQINLIGKKVCL